MISVSAFKELTKSNQLSREFIDAVNKNSLTGKDYHARIAILGMGAVGNAVFDALLSVHQYDYAHFGSPVSSLYLASARGSSKKLEIMTKQAKAIATKCGLEDKIEAFNGEDEKVAEQLHSKTDLIVVAFGAPVFNLQQAELKNQENSENAEMSVAAYRAVEGLKHLDLDYRFEHLPGNLPLIKRWAELLQGYKGHVMVYTNPTDILAYAFAAFSGLANQTSGFNHIDTWRTRNALLREIAGTTMAERDLVYAIGEHGKGLVVRASGTRFEQRRKEIQEKVREYAKQMKEGLGEDTWIRKEMTPASEEALQAFAFNTSGVTMSVLMADGDKKRFIGLPVCYEGVFAKPLAFELNTPEHSEFKDGCDRLDSVLSTLISGGILPKIKAQVSQADSNTVMLRNIRSLEEISIKPEQQLKLAVETTDFSLHLFDISDPKSQPPIKIHTGNISDYSSSGTSLFTVRECKNIEEFDVLSGELKHTYRSLPGRLVSCAALDGFVYAASSSAKAGAILMWEQGKDSVPLIKHNLKFPVSIIAAASINELVNLFAVSEDKILRFNYHLEAPVAYSIPESEDISMIRVSGDRLFARSFKGKVYQWNLQDQSPVASFDSSPGFFEIRGEHLFVPNRNEIAEHNLRTGEFRTYLAGLRKLGGACASENRVFAADEDLVHVFSRKNCSHEFYFPIDGARTIYSMKVI